jgi:hypothetical protein
VARNLFLECLRRKSDLIPNLLAHIDREMDTSIVLDRLNVHNRKIYERLAEEIINHIPIQKYLEHEFQFKALFDLVIKFKIENLSTILSKNIFQNLKRVGYDFERICSLIEFCYSRDNSDDNKMKEKLLSLVFA